MLMCWAELAEGRGSAVERRACVQGGGQMGGTRRGSWAGRLTHRVNGGWVLTFNLGAFC